MHYILPPVSVVILWWLSSFKHVTLDGDTLIIRGYRREARIPASQIERIGKHRGFRDPDFITIVFKSKTEFGRRVRIMTGISSNDNLDLTAKKLQSAMDGKNSGVKIHLAPRETALEPTPAKAKVVIVSGWSNDELSGILTDFADVYDDRFGSHFDYEIHPHDQGVIRIIFPHDIPAQLFAFFINYLQYPKDYDLKTHSISVVGKALLTPDFHPPSKSLIGQQAVFYIPSNDQDFDVVYVRVGDDTYEASFAARRWKKVDDSRIPPGLEIKS
jgi:hypothetical protein